jgi:oxygen-dependent protoporphyrinogen oxidase
VAAAPLTVVVGAGISGLTCAYALKKSGGNVLVLEAAHRAGGVIRSISDKGFLCELGPQSFSGTESLLQLCDQLGISGQLIEAPHAAPRYIWLNGKMVAAPLSPGALLASPLLGWKTKLSILTEFFRTSPAPLADESVAAFVRARFSQELLDRLVGPFIFGIYAGDPERLSLRAAFPKIYEAQKLSGSVVRGSLRLAGQKTAANKSRRRPGLFSFQQGNETLTNAIVNVLGSSLRCGVTSSIERQGTQFLLKLASTAGSETILADKLVLATPAPVNSYLLGQLAPSASWSTFDIEYARVTVVSLGYRKDQIAADLRGFGFLIPRTENLRTLGCVWNSSLFPGRAPAGNVLITGFIGGAGQTNSQPFSKEENGESVRREVGAILRISGGPVIEQVTDYTAAIPQFNLGHNERLDSIQKAVTKVPNLWIVGNYWKGPAIGACIQHSLAVAEQIPIG